MLIRGGLPVAAGASSVVNVFRDIEEGLIVVGADAVYLPLGNGDVIESGRAICGEDVWRSEDSQWRLGSE